MKYVSAIGNRNAKLMIVGDSPSYYGEEVAFGNNRVLDAILREARINKNDVWLTNISKYFIKPNITKGKKVSFINRASESGVDLEKEINDFRTEVNTIKPNVILALGDSALFTLTNRFPLDKWRGSVISAYGTKVIGTYNPFDIINGSIKGYWNKQLVLFDINRARVQSEFSETRRPNRILKIAKSSGEFHDFIEFNKGRFNPSIDIEAFHCIPICVGISFNPSYGVTIPLWNSYNISSISDSELVVIWKMLSELLAQHEVVGQNFGYDRDKLRRLGFVVRGLFSDTMLKSFVLNPELPKNLAFNTSIYTDESYYKDEGMYEGSTNDLLIGCARDACVTKEIDLAMQVEIDKYGYNDYYRKFILPLHEMYHYNENLDAIEQNGFNVNEEFRHELIKKYITQDEQIRYNLFQLTQEYVNTGSPKQVSELLYNKLRIPARKGVGEEVLTQLLNNSVKNPFHKKTIELILEDRRVKKTLSSYLYSPTDFDGRMRTSYFLCLDTGRSATQQQEPPIRPNVSYEAIEEGKKVKKNSSRGMAFQTITKHGDIGADVRKILVVDEGHIFLQADSSQAEARVIFLLAEDYQALKDIDEHDYHALTASWFFGGCEDDYSKKKLGYESPIRFAGKTLRHAGHLGASKRRAAIEINTQARKYKIDYKISEQLAERALKVFHAKQPKIRGVFHAGIIELINKTRKLIAPVPYGIEAPIGGARTFFERAGEDLYRQAFSYIPQRTVSENTKAAGMRIKKRFPDCKILVEAHDALLFQVKEGLEQELAKIIKEEFERPIDFSKCSLSRGELIIPCDVEFGYNYKDLSKFKFL